MVPHQFLGTLEILQPACIGRLLSHTQDPLCDASSYTPDSILDEVTGLPNILKCFALHAWTSFVDIIICYLAHAHIIGVLV
jgi:hypothetical protein